MVNLKEKKTIFKSGSSFKEAAKYTICAIFFLMAALAYIWPHIKIVKLGYEKGKLRKKYEKLVQTNRLMRIEVASLRSLEKVESIAVKDLKMVFPDDSQVVVVRSSSNAAQKNDLEKRLIADTRP